MDSMQNILPIWPFSPVYVSNRSDLIRLRANPTVHIADAEHALVAIPDNRARAAYVIALRPTYLGISNKVWFAEFNDVLQHRGFGLLASQFVYALAASRRFVAKYIHECAMEMILASIPVITSRTLCLFTFSAPNVSLVNKTLKVGVFDIKTEQIRPDQWLLVSEPRKSS